MRHFIQVTQEDIDEGVAEQCLSCPVARAIKRALGYPVGVSSVIFEPSTDRKICELPEGVVRWIMRFDEGRAVNPLNFYINVPQSIS